MSFSFPNKNKSKKSNPKAASQLRYRRMSIEPLEHRQLLTTFLVDAVGDVDDGNLEPGQVTLREAINVANFVPGADLIMFDTDGAFSTPQDFDMAGGQMHITESLTIDGPGADCLTIDAVQSQRHFNFDAEGGEFTIRGLTLTGGTAAASGGSILLINGDLDVEESVISGNSASTRWGGGIYAESETNLTVSNSTISGNSASWGGGLLSYGHTTVQNSTVSGNSAASGGGGMYVADATIINSTVTDNVASSGGGVDTKFGSSLVMANSIVAGNTATLQSDFDLSDITISANYSLIGDTAGEIVGGTGNVVGDSTGSGIIDPLLTPLGNYGGVMQTHALMTGSPAANSADPAIQYDSSSFDQRGMPFFRVQDGRMDMGALEDNISDELIVDNSSDVSDGIITAGELSLREAVELANLDPGVNTISFDTSGAFNNSSQIDLTNGELVITESITLGGPGADRLTIDAGGNSRIFNVTATEGDFVIAGLTLTGADAVVGVGGAIRIAGGDVHVLDSFIVGNSASDTIAGTGYGGGIYAPESANLTVRNSTVSGNTGRFGAGIMALGSLTVANSTVSGNAAIYGAGGIFGVNTEVLNSTITDNAAVATHGGGGIEIRPDAGAFLTVHNSIIAGNTIMGGNFHPDLDLDTNQVALTVNYSMIGDADGIVISGSGNIIGDTQGGNAVDPQLETLADNGGSTPTHALMPGSFAIDDGDRFDVAGEDGVPLYDQRGAGFARVYDGRIDMGAFELQPNSVPDSDFNDDGLYDCTDIDALVAEIATGFDDELFDLNSDGTVDLADRDAWLAEAGSVNLPSGNAYLLGDANLDGTVDGADFLTWNASKFTSAAAWCQGDFNADGSVDGGDFLLWNANKFTSADITSPNDNLDAVENDRENQDLNDEQLVIEESKIHELPRSSNSSRAVVQVGHGVARRAHRHNDTDAAVMSPVDGVLRTWM